MLKQGVKNSDSNQNSDPFVNFGQNHPLPSKIGIVFESGSPNHEQILICKYFFPKANDTYSIIHSIMHTLKTLKSNSGIEKYAVQTAQIFGKFKTPRFRAKPNDVIQHQSEASTGFYDFCQVAFYP